MSFIILLLLMVGLIIYLKRGNASNKEEIKKEQYYPYHRSGIMTAAEYNFFKVLEEAVQDKYYIVPQVVLCNLVDVNSGYTWNKSYRSKIDKKRIDFVLFNKTDYSPYIAIEYDDSSHLTEESKINDEFKDELFKRIGIRLERIVPVFNYKVENLKERLGL